MRKIFTTSLTAIALATSAPVLAQIETEDQSAEEVTDAEMEAAMAMLGGMFAVEPLTAEQETRLPLATQIVAKLIPDGTMVELMGSMFDGMLGPLMNMELEGSGAVEAVAASLGVDAYELTLTDEEAAELAAMVDPAWKERKEVETALLPEIMATMMGTMEPGMRRAMSELYAINFSEAELKDIDAFFSTETGATYARKSFTMASDPRIISVSMEALPAMMGAAGEVEAKREEALGDIPPARTYDELSTKEQARISEVTGLSAEDLADLSYDDAAEGAMEDDSN